MASKKINYLKLGLFVLAGIGFLILLLYVIGKNQNLFGSNFQLKARFTDVHGLVTGNNIRFAGIDAGTVKEIDVINDTTIEVTMLVKTRMRKFIYKNATVSIGTDNLIGNKILNIESARSPAPVVEEGDMLVSKAGTDPEEMLEVLKTTNYDLAEIASQLKLTVQRINNSKVMWSLLDDATLPASIRHSLSRIRSSSEYLNTAMKDLHEIVEDVKRGKGTAGILLRDSAIAFNVNTTIENVNDAVEKIKGVRGMADSLSAKVNALVEMISYQISSGKGTVNALLKDKEMADRLRNTMKNIEQDTRSFNEVMEALKNSFLFRGYFRKLEKQKKEQAKTQKY